ncbi:hypothetical protein IWW48_005329 [Coemansia sp. RSA 1200]|nr:hypothetical protein IWW48_005329 [Coemansia sp. RSA 1200]
MASGTTDAGTLSSPPKRKRGRPRKEEAAATAETTTILSPPKRQRGRPRREDRPLLAELAQPQKQAPGRRRGRPGKSTSTDNLKPTPHGEEGIVTKRRRGRPRKHAVVEDAGSGQDARVGSGGGDSGSEYSDRYLDMEEFIKQPVVRAGAKRGGKPKTKKAPAVLLELGGGIADGSKVKMGKHDDRRRCLWSGPPGLADLDEPVDPARCAGCIDLGTDEDVWKSMRQTSVALGDIELETDAANVRLHVGSSGGDTADAAALAVVLGRTRDDGRQAGGPDRELELELEPLGTPHRFTAPGGSRGWIGSTGMAVTSVDWAPRQRNTECLGTCTDYIAVGGLDAGATTSGAAATSIAGQTYLERDKQPRPGAIQIWTTHIDPRSKQSTPDESCRLAALLLHTFGRCLMLKWCPISIPAAEGGCSEGAAAAGIVGFLAAIFGDGYLRVCAVPDAHLLCTDANTDAAAMRWPRKPLLEVRAPHGIFTSLDWACSDIVVASTSKGAVTAWLVGHGANTAAPILNHPAHAGPIPTTAAFSTVAAAQSGSNTAGCFTRVSAAAIQVISTGCDGKMQRLLLALPMRKRYSLIRSPGRLGTCALFWATRSVLFPDFANSVRALRTPAMAHTPDPAGRAVLGYYGGSDTTIGSDAGAAAWNSGVDWHATDCYHSTGSVLQIASSEFHPFAAIAGANGKLAVQNVETSVRTKRMGSMHRLVYSLVWDSQNDRLLCRSGWCFPNLPAKRGPSNSDFAIFPPQVAVHCCAWSRNPLTSAWLASAGASGLLRIESASRLTHI